MNQECDRFSGNMHSKPIAVLNEMEIHLLSLSRLDAQPIPLTLNSPQFILLFLADTRQLSQDQIAEFGDWCLKQGMVYLCAWGPDCERVHDIVDLIIVKKEIAMGRELPLIMTTWHDNETLQDALWFALNNASPDDAHSETCKSLLIVIVDNPDWEMQVRELLKTPNYFPG